MNDLCDAGVSAAPFVAGAAARAVTAFAVSPMELIRVRVQGSAAPAGIPYAQQLLSTVRSIHAQGEVRVRTQAYAYCEICRCCNDLRLQSCMHRQSVLDWRAASEDAHRLLQGQGVAKLRSFWRGMGVTLAKDVPFAAAYWSVLEPLRATMLPRNPSASPAQVWLQPIMSAEAFASWRVGRHSTMSTPTFLSSGWMRQ